MTFLAINGVWGSWTSWSVPTQTCGTGGSSTRTRLCDSPAPAYGGKPCPGRGNDSKDVHLPPCRKFVFSQFIESRLKKK